ncbi:S9 family peptidase [Fulvivirgaceae bacterium BMA10]|uniref:S9 family peptidase n=1 Tax=Splendidivirga corallicola TaxID=3051826 RepID=A0ABT8L055_9BACT|nr:S9 family peptidase [Fulvivirgaceae bacterium BMA10]
MKPGKTILLSLLIYLTFSTTFAQEQDRSKLQLIDVFDLEYATDPQVSQDGKQIVYLRNFMDIMKDRIRTNLWIINSDGSDHRPLTSGNKNNYSPRWSPDGKKMVYVSTQDGSSQIYMRWMDTGQTAKLTNLTSSPGNLVWSPDGEWIAFTMFVTSKPKSFAKMPAKPKGAEWAEPAKYIDQLRYRADGAGYLKEGYTQLFVLSADGGSPRQITFDNYNYGGRVSWTPDSKAVIISANRHSNAAQEPLNSELYKITLSNGNISQLTSRKGPDNNPVVSPDGKTIAYLGFDDTYQGYEVTRLYTCRIDGSNAKLITSGLDRSVASPVWSSDGKGIYFQYDDEGNTKIALASLNGKIKDITNNVGQTSLGRPYSGGSYTVSDNGLVAFTNCTPDRPADVAVVNSGTKKRLTELNDDLFSFKKTGKVEEIWFESSHDKRKVQGWIVKPSDFDPAKKYPLILEIHGGPFANYGDRFSAEIQLYAAAGYVVLYVNPRGSTSYGKEFGNLIHHNYPGQDYDDLMSGVDAVIKQGYVDENNLFVTGGSGGGVLTAWIVGKTDRFKAAVVAKPVINWYSFALTADAYNFFHKYWFPGFPWDHADHYMKRSPISLVGNVKTPTMLLTGESDYRTPISETEQYYQALKLRNVETAMVRIPGAPHGIAGRPSNLMAKVANILAWFEKYR